MPLRIPNEVLVEIFHAVPFTLEDRSREEYAICLSQVSRLWREIALGTRSLWTTIHVDYLSIGDGQLSYLDLFLSRSREFPLDILIHLVRHSDDEYWEEFLPQMRKIICLISRWQSLHLFYNIEGDIHAALHPLGVVAAPVLEVFKVKYVLSSNELDDDYVPLILFGGGAPRLAHINIEIPITACQPPLSSLISLHLRNYHNPYDIDQYRSILTASNHLTDLRLLGTIADAEELYMTAVSKTYLIEIPSLRTLTVAPSWSERSLSLYSVLASLHTPALESLAVQCCMTIDHISEFQNVFRNFEPPRYPQLRSLTLKWANLSHPGPFWFPAALPSITYLSLLSCKSPGRLLNSLIPFEGHPIAAEIDAPCNLMRANYASDVADFPSLRDIYIRSMNSEDLAALCHLISNRISRNTPIVSVQFPPTTISKIPQDQLEWLRERVRVEVFEADFVV